MYTVQELVALAVMQSSHSVSLFLTYLCKSSHNVSLFLTYLCKHISCKILVSSILQFWQGVCKTMLGGYSCIHVTIQRTRIVLANVH